MKEQTVRRLRIANLYKAKREFSDEVDKWPMFYSEKQIIETFNAIRQAISKAENDDINTSQPSTP